MIQVEKLVKKFGSFTAVNNMTFAVPKGEILALLGPNGAGKTTTVRMLTALIAPTAGKATVAGYDTVSQAQAVHRSVGLLTEVPGLYERMTAARYLHYFGELQGVSPARITECTKRLLKLFDLWDVRNRRIGTYSKGMRQKTALIRAVLHDPVVLFLDEPTSALDPAGAKTVRDYIAGLRTAGKTIIVNTHNLHEAEQLADHIAIVRRGQIIGYGTIAELKQRLLGPAVFAVRYREYTGALSRLDALLSEIAGIVVLEVTMTGLQFSSEDPERVNPLVLRGLVEAGIELITASEVKRSLEAVYLRMVEEQEPSWRLSSPGRNG